MRKTTTLIFALSLLHAATAMADSGHASRPIPAVHDLQDIRNSAEVFVQSENGRLKTRWLVANPNPKIIVEQCARPLQSDWAKAGDMQSRKSVKVTCAATAHDHKGWRVFLPVTTSAVPQK